MSDTEVNPLDDPNSDAAQAYAEERRENIRTFVRTSSDYYIDNFNNLVVSLNQTDVSESSEWVDNWLFIPPKHHSIYFV